MHRHRPLPAAPAPAERADPAIRGPARRLHRRGAMAAVLATAMPGALAGLLSACATSPLPALHWVRLPADAAGAPPATARAAAPAATPASAEVWQLMAPVALPGYLDRDALLVPQGPAGLQPLDGARWAEPLRDAVPRLLRADLGRSLGQPMWSAPLPPGVRPTRQLRIELSAFDVTADGRGVAVQARWSVADAAGARPPRVAEAAFVTPVDAAAPAADADALAAAHRQALWELAQRIGQSLAAGGG